MKTITKTIYPTFGAIILIRFALSPTVRAVDPVAMVKEQAA
jgi:hypothetical protein